MNKKITIIKHHTILNNKWVEIHKNDYLLPDNSIIRDYYILEEKPGVNIVAITKDNNILIVKQYRPAIDKYIYDFPAGMIDEPNIKPQVQAQRELLEETGYKSSSWIQTGKVYPAPHRMRKIEICFLAKNIQKASEQKLDDTEFIEYELIPLKKLEKLIKMGKFNCAVCISSLYKAKSYLIR